MLFLSPLIVFLYDSTSFHGYQARFFREGKIECGIKKMNVSALVFSIFDGKNG